jgi:cell division protein FtsL
MSAVAVHSPRRLASVDAPTTVDVPVGGASGRRTLALALATAVVIVAAVFGIVGLTALAANAAVEARALELQVAQAERRYAELVAEVAAKEDPGRIRELALELGLVPSPAARHLMLSRGLDADGSRRPIDAGPLLADPLKPVLTQGR